MNKFYRLIFSISLLFVIPSSIFATDTILVGQTKDQVIAELGKPLKQTSRDGYDIFWYTSTAASQANLFYFQKDQVRIISESIANMSFDSQITTLGTPDESFKRYPNKNDSFQQYLHTWKSKGIIITTAGNATNSSIIRKDIFSQKKYEEVISLLYPEIRQTPPKATTSSLSWISIIIGVFVVCGIAFLTRKYFRVWRK